MACSSVDICLCLCASHVFVICESLSLSPFIIMLTMMTTKLMLMMVPGLPHDADDANDEDDNDYLRSTRAAA